MYHSGPNYAVVASMMWFGLNGVAFAATVPPIGGRVGKLIASDGRTIAAACANGDDRPLINRSLAADYWAIRARYERLAKVQEN